MRKILMGCVTSLFIGAGGYLFGADMFPAVVDKAGVTHKNQTYIEDGRKIREFGLYRADGKEFPIKMRVELSQPCFIINPGEWSSYKKIDEFSAELIDMEPSSMAGFVGDATHSPLYYNDDLPPVPVYLLGVKGCEEAPNAVTITAYQKIDGNWKYKGKATFIIKK